MRYSSCCRNNLVGYRLEKLNALGITLYGGKPIEPFATFNPFQASRRSGNLFEHRVSDFPLNFTNAKNFLTQNSSLLRLVRSPRCLSHDSCHHSHNHCHHLPAAQHFHLQVTVFHQREQASIFANYTERMHL